MCAIDPAALVAETEGVAVAIDNSGERSCEDHSGPVMRIEEADVIEADI